MNSEPKLFNPKTTNMLPQIKHLLLGIVLLASFQLEAAAKKKVLKPYLHNRKVQVEMVDKDKAQNYFQLSSRHATFYRPEGPGQLTLYLRSVIKNASSARAYKVKLILDGVKVSVYEIPVRKLSKKSRLRGTGEALSVAAKVKLRIPPGRHKLEVLGIDLPGVTIIRAYHRDLPDPKWANSTFVGPSETVQLRSVKSDKLLDYQRIKEGQTLNFDASEKQYVRILFRGEFKAHMFADNTVRIDLYQDGVLLRNIRISSQRTDAVLYADGGSLVPGTLNKFYFEVPEGNHHYEVVVADKRKSVLVRVSLAPVVTKQNNSHANS